MVAARPGKYISSKKRQHGFRHRVFQLTMRLPNVVSMGRLCKRLSRQASDERHLKHLHNPIQQSMYNLEPALLVRIGGTQVSVVSRHAFFTGILNGNVGAFKDSEGQGERLVFTQCLQESRHERCAYDLEFLCCRVEEFDGGRVAVLSVQVGKVFVVRALRQGQFWFKEEAGDAPRSAAEPRPIPRGRIPDARYHPTC